MKQIAKEERHLLYLIMYYPGNHIKENWVDGHMARVEETRNACWVFGEETCRVCEDA